MLFGSPVSSPSSPASPGSSRRPRHTRPPLESPGQLAIIAIVVWLVGVAIHPLGILAPLGLVLLLVAGIAYLPRPQTMYWRGRRIDLNDTPGPIERLYRVVFRR
jgi:hypothetical protein